MKSGNKKWDLMLGVVCFLISNVCTTLFALFIANVIKDQYMNFEYGWNKMSLAIHGTYTLLTLCSFFIFSQRYDKVVKTKMD